MIEDNELISNFMNVDFICNYNDNWNLLMLVIEKIESLDLRDKFYSWKDNEKTYFNFDYIAVEIEQNRCWIYAQLQLDLYFDIARVEGSTKIEAVYKAVVTFLKWYNKDE